MSSTNVGSTYGYDLRPCPYCGRRGYNHIEKDGKTWFQAMCLHCGTRGPQKQNLESAAYSWNDLPRRTGNKM